MNWKLTFTRPWYMTENLVVTSHPSQKASTSFWFHLFFPSTWHLAQIPAIPHNTLTRAAENTSPNHRNTFQTVCIRKHYPICVLGATPRSIFAFWHWIFFLPISHKMIWHTLGNPTPCLRDRHFVSRGDRTCQHFVSRGDRTCQVQNDYTLR